MSGIRNCKVVLLGQANSGKSCLVDRFVHSRYDDTAQVASIGASYAAKKLTTEVGEVVISLWDTAGAERFDSLSRLYYSGAEAAIICIELTDSVSFTKAQFWAKELKQHQPGCRCYIALCKCDLLETPPKGFPPLQEAPRLGREVSDRQATQDNSDASERLAWGVVQLEAPSDGQHGVRSKAGDSGHADSKPPAACQPVPPRQGNKQGDRQSSDSQDERIGGGSQAGAGSPWKRKQVSDSQLQAVGKSLNARIAATSALTGQGVPELFQMIADDLAHLPQPALEHSVDTPRGSAHLPGLPSMPSLNGGNCQADPLDSRRRSQRCPKPSCCS